MHVPLHDEPGVSLPLCSASLMSVEIQARRAWNQAKGVLVVRQEALRSRMALMHQELEGCSQVRSGERVVRKELLK